ncbi:hypothetical protein BDZ89DRAFT_1084218 [Hymenopellis radicata]|nr:hypothetical protein BDZ89DRAFT_1084218 [Hymenopellis radicata]
MSYTVPEHKTNKAKDALYPAETTTWTPQTTDFHGSTTPPTPTMTRPPTVPSTPDTEYT